MTVPRSCRWLLGVVLLTLGLALLPSFRSSSAALVEGTVSDGTAPLEGVRLRWKATSVSVLSDRTGRFRVEMHPGEERRLTGWKEGYLIGGITPGRAPLRLTLEPLPAEDNPEYHWVDPDPDPAEPHNCANCHRALHAEWAEGGHARSARGRRFQNLYAGTTWSGKSKAGWSLLDEHPLGAAVCASCHAPALEPGDPAQFDLTQIGGTAAKGVHCDYCHKISGLGAGNFGLTHGRYMLQLLRPQEGQLFFGPLDDVDRGEDSYSPLYRESRYCAACHEGVVFGVHVYSTYSEWRASPAARQGQQCQDCHMKPTGHRTNIAPGHGGVTRAPHTLGNHRFFAGSQAEMLQQALQVDVGFDRQGTSVEARVQIRTKQVGHRIPTGFIDRQLLLLVTGAAENQVPLRPLQGPLLPAEAGVALQGTPGKLFARILKDEQGRSPAPFWRVASDPIDTRLRPEETETFRYVFPATLRTVRIRLVHRRFWDETTRSKGWPDSDLVVLDRSFPSAP